MSNETSQVLVGVVDGGEAGLVLAEELVPLLETLLDPVVGDVLKFSVRPNEPFGPNSN